MYSCRKAATYTFSPGTSPGILAADDTPYIEIDLCEDANYIFFAPYMPTLFALHSR